MPWARSSRDAAGQSSRPAAAERPYDAARPPVPPARRLQEKTGVNRLLLVLAALGAVAGGTVGAVVLVAVLGDDTSVAALALGVVSAAVLGGFFAFLLSSFCFVFSRALGEALGDPAAAGARERRYALSAGWARGEEPTGSAHPPLSAGGRIL